MSFLDRLINFGVAQVTQLFYLYHSQATETEIFRRHKGRNFPDLLELSANSQLSLINSMSVLDFPAPQSSNMLYSGGFTVDKNRRPLSEASFPLIEGGASMVLISNQPFRHIGSNFWQYLYCEKKTIIVYFCFKFFLNVSFNVFS